MDAAGGGSIIYDPSIALVDWLGSVRWAAAPGECGGSPGRKDLFCLDITTKELSILLAPMILP